MNEILKQLQNDKIELENSIIDYEESMSSGYDFNEELEICCQGIVEIEELERIIGGGI